MFTFKIPSIVKVSQDLELAVCFSPMTGPLKLYMLLSENIQKLIEKLKFYRNKLNKETHSRSIQSTSAFTQNLMQN